MARGKRFFNPPASATDEAGLVWAPQKNVLRAGALDEFVAQSDSLGGPDSQATQAYWASLRYQPDFIVDITKDPYSEDYVSQQVRLWEELSGRPFNQELNELCHFPFSNHVEAANPYARRDASAFAQHLASLANVAIMADLPVAPRILDLGCGWGLTSEVFAFLGAEVTAIDINQGFVDLVNARAQRLGLPIRAFRATFEGFEPNDVFDMVLFYECLHHAVRPWSILERFSHHLADNGKIVLAREPVQNLFWPHWGMRLDPFSIYCMRKFGWFESGFSRNFLASMAKRAGFTLEERPDPHASVPLYMLHPVVSQKQGLENIPLNVLSEPPHAGWLREGEAFLVAGDRAMIDLATLPGGEHVELVLHNYRGRSIALTLQQADAPPVSRPLKPGSNVMRFAKVGILRFEAETWRPCDELASQDDRELSFHLARIETYSRIRK